MSSPTCDIVTELLSQPPGPLQPLCKKAGEVILDLENQLACARGEVEGWKKGHARLLDLHGAAIERSERSATLHFTRPSGGQR